MANVNWQGGKAKGRIQAKAWLRHNDPEQRIQTNHSNVDIRKELTPLNASIGVCADMTYEERTARLDALLDAYDYQEGAGKNMRVSVQGVCVYPPDGLLVYDAGSDMWLLTPQLRRWFELACSEWEDMNGEEYSLGAFIDCDEQHWYKPKGEKDFVLSKIHMHLYDVPVIDGRISGKAFSARARMVEFNKRLEDMTQREFGIDYNSGKGKNPNGNQSMEELKAESERIESVIFDMDKAIETLEEAEQLRDDIEQQIEDMRGDIYTGVDGKEYSGINGVRKKRNALVRELNDTRETLKDEQDRLSEASRRADAQERRADSAAARADSAQAIASQAEQRLKDTQDKESKTMQNVTDAQKLLDEWEQFVTTIEDNLKTSNDMVQTWDAYSDVIHETGLYNKQSETDRAAFDAVQAARDNNPWSEMYEAVLELLRKLRQFKQRMQLMQASREHADTSTVDAFGGNQYEDAGFGR